MSDTFPSLRAQTPVFLHAKLFCARCVYACVYICPIVLLLYVSQPPPPHSALAGADRRRQPPLINHDCSCTRSLLANEETGCKR